MWFDEVFHRHSGQRVQSRRDGAAKTHANKCYNEKRGIVLGLLTVRCKAG